MIIICTQVCMVTYPLDDLLQTCSPLPPKKSLYVIVVRVSLVTVWKERTPWLHWRGSTEDLREMLY